MHVFIILISISANNDCKKRGSLAAFYATRLSSENLRLRSSCIGISMSPCIGHNNIRGNKSHRLLSKLGTFTSARGRKNGNDDQPSRFRFQPRKSEVHIRSATFLANKDDIFDKQIFRWSKSFPYGNKLARV